MKTIRDAIHGDIEFDAVEMALIDSPAMQRLRGIKQLGTSSLVYPSAVHTRFEHSLGACWMTKRLLDSLTRNGHKIDEESRRIAPLAALLHDVTHVPFGHTFEDERRLFERHDEDEERLDFFLSQPEVARPLQRLGVEQAVRDVLTRGNIVPPFVRQLVAGAVSADLLDYLKRDAYFTGLSLSYDDRLFHYFHLSESNPLSTGSQAQLVVRLHKDGAFRRDALSELVHLLQIRYALTERVYYHHAKIASGAMVSRALELAIESGAFSRRDLYDLRDDSFLERLRAMGNSAPGLAELVCDLWNRSLYTRVYVLTSDGLGRPGLSADERSRLASRFHSELAARKQAEESIASSLGVSPSDVIVYCPSASMALKEADVPVEVSAGRVQQLSELGHPDVTALREKHAGLWRFFVFLRKQHAGKRLRAGQICEAYFGYPNQLEPLRTGKLVFGEA